MTTRPDARTLTLDEYIDAREDMGRERRRNAPLSYGIHSADAIMARYRKYTREWQWANGSEALP